MKILRLSLLLILPIFLSDVILAQNLELTNFRRDKTIKTGTYLRLAVFQPSQYPGAPTEYKILKGKMIQYDKGILKMQVTHISERPSGDSVCYYYTEKVFSSQFELPTMEIKKEDVVNIEVHGKNKYGKRSTGENIGRLVSVIGFGHLVSAPIAGEDQAGLLLGLGLAEIAGGIIIAEVFKHPSFVIQTSPLKTKNSGQLLWVIK